MMPMDADQCSTGIPRQKEIDYERVSKRRSQPQFTFNLPNEEQTFGLLMRRNPMSMREMLLPLFSVLVLGTMLPILTTSLARAQDDRPAMKLVGGVEIVSVGGAQDMALPREKYRAIHFVRSNEFFSKYPDRSKTPSGLYLLDTELIPRQLPEILTLNSLALGPNGSILNQKGEKIVMLLRHKLVAVRRNQGSVSRSVNGAAPFPLEWVSAWWSWHDDEGFCRSLTASTGADAWGPIVDVWGDRVHTNIEQIETFAWAADAQDDELCENCAWSFSQAYRDFGCWWPAHGGGLGGFADLKDGSFNWSVGW
jgi:hypothetical protein